jgi:hypothetical protein
MIDLLLCVLLEFLIAEEIVRRWRTSGRALQRYALAKREQRRLNQSLKAQLADLAAENRALKAQIGE